MSPNSPRDMMNIPIIASPGSLNIVDSYPRNTTYIAKGKKKNQMKEPSLHYVSIYM